MPAVWALWFLALGLAEPVYGESAWLSTWMFRLLNTAGGAVVMAYVVVVYVRMRRDPGCGLAVDLDGLTSKCGFRERSIKWTEVVGVGEWKEGSYRSVIVQPKSGLRLAIPVVFLECDASEVHELVSSMRVKAELAS